MAMAITLHTITKQALKAFHSKPQGTWLFIGSQTEELVQTVLSLMVNLHDHEENECLRCKQINALTHPDIHFLTPSDSGSIGISEVHRAVHNLHTTRHDSGMHYRAVIVKGAQSLTTEAQNAFLKTLEEPPADAIIFLITDDPSKLLETVTSRSRSVWFRPQKIDSADSRNNLLETENTFQRLVEANHIDGATANELVESAQIKLSQRLRQAKASQLPEILVSQEALERLQRNLNSNVAPKTAVSAFLLELA